MDEKELEAIEADYETAKDMYNGVEVGAFGQQFPCVTCIFLQTHTTAFIQAIRDRDKRIANLKRELKNSSSRMKAVSPMLCDTSQTSLRKQIEFNDSLQ